MKRYTSVSQSWQGKHEGQSRDGWCINSGETLNLDLQLSFCMHVPLHLYLSLLFPLLCSISAPFYCFCNFLLDCPFCSLPMLSERLCITTSCREAVLCWSPPQFNNCVAHCSGSLSISGWNLTKIYRNLRRKSYSITLIVMYNSTLINMLADHWGQVDLNSTSNW